MADVCLVLEGTWPFLTGGVAEWVDRLITGLTRGTGLSVAVVHLRDGEVPPPEPVYDTAACAGIVVTGADNPERTAAALPPATVYHALSTGPASDVAAAAARRHGAALVVTEHGLAWREAELGVGEIRCGRVPPAERAPLVAALRASARRAYDAADAVTTVCEANAREQRRLGAVDPLVIVNPAPPPGPPRLGPRAQPVIGFIGRVVPIKDVATFVQAARRLRTRLEGARFVVVGPLDHDPDYAEHQIRAGAGFVSFEGERDGQAAAADLDVLVLPSISEAQPLVALEAMAAGTPVVASAVGGLPELLGGGRGELVEPGDAHGIADAVERLCSDRTSWLTRSRAGQAHVALHHREDVVVEAYRSLYTAWVA